VFFSCYVAFNGEKSEKDEEEPEVPYKLPDGNVIQVNARKTFPLPSPFLPSGGERDLMMTLNAFKPSSLSFNRHLKILLIV